MAERKERKIPFNKWSFVDQHGRDDQHWYVRLEGGEYHDVIYRYMDVKLNDTTKSINFDYEVVEYRTEVSPHGEPLFNEALGEILKSILDDTIKQQDYILGPKDKGE
jgi:hypothetical protein|tara:strand:- start:445 stop:765 length:321 start_codon:yes stop_codon:yes gene_type:complete